MFLTGFRRMSFLRFSQQARAIKKEDPWSIQEMSTDGALNRSQVLNWERSILQATLSKTFIHPLSHFKLNYFFFKQCHKMKHKFSLYERKYYSWFEFHTTFILNWLLVERSNIFLKEQILQICSLCLIDFEIKKFINIMKNK